MGGRLNASGKSTVSDERRLHKNYYNTIHKCRVDDVNFNNGTMSVSFVNGGSGEPNVPLPLMGFSFPPKDSTDDQNYKKTSWGVYYPQKDDILLIGYDALGEPFTLGYSVVDFPIMERFDQATEERGGIGWGEASGKRMRPGDWHWKSARNSSFYMGDKLRIASGPHSITLDQNTTNSEITIQTDLVHTWYGNVSEKREGSARRLLVPGVDAIESPVTGSFGTTAQECTNYVKRSSLTALGGLLMVHDSLGEVIDDNTKQIMLPGVAYPELTELASSTGVRVYRTVKDDATGQIDLYTELVDNLGNRGVSAKTATAFQWATPLAAWKITNLSVDWTTTSTFDLTALQINLTATSSITLTAPEVKLGGSGAVEGVVKENFIDSLDVALGLIQKAASVAGTPDPTGAAAATFAQTLGLIAEGLSKALPAAASKVVKAI